MYRGTEMIIDSQSSKLKESSISNKSPLVSILINNYNYAQYLSQAIDSALGQTYINTEVIVVDDGSTDNSREVINGYGNQIIPVFKKNGGQASAINAGFAASKGEIICLLDADDIFLPGKVSEIIDCWKKYPNIDWFFHESFPVQSEDLVNIDLNKFIAEIPNQDSEDLPKPIDFRKKIINGEFPTFTPSTSNLCFSRRILEKIFPLPEAKGASRMAITDLYFKYLAVGLGVGCSTKRNLGIFRLHNNNTYTGQELTKKRKFYTEIHITTGYYMQVNFPKFTKLSQKIFSKGFATYLRNQNHDINSGKLIKDYFDFLSLTEHIEVRIKTIYYFFKLLFKDFV